jgi:hypothetical protein
MLAGNPLLWGKAGGSYSASDASGEMAHVHTDHIAPTLAGVLIGSGLILLFLNRAGFRFAVEASGGRG